MRRSLLRSGWLLGLLLCVGQFASAQSAKQNLAKFDYRPYHFGFLLSGNSSSFNFNLRPDFTFADSLPAGEQRPVGLQPRLAGFAGCEPHGPRAVHPGLSFQDRGLLFRFREPVAPSSRSTSDRERVPRLSHPARCGQNALATLPPMP